VRIPPFAPGRPAGWCACHDCAAEYRSAIREALRRHRTRWATMPELRWASGLGAMPAGYFGELLADLVARGDVLASRCGPDCPALLFLLSANMARPRIASTAGGES
jgi:hypothetical protein